MKSMFLLLVLHQAHLQAAQVHQAHHLAVLLHQANHLAEVNQEALLLQAVQVFQTQVQQHRVELEHVHA